MPKGSVASWSNSESSLNIALSCIAYHRSPLRTPIRKLDASAAFHAASLSSAHQPRAHCHTPTVRREATYKKPNYRPVAPTAHTWAPLDKVM
ncbi:hypothetical protein JCM10599A_58450 [Paraburkholderia kururiensis]